MSPLFYSFWSINDAIDQSRLRRQMDEMQRAGLDGVVFHPRFYPNDPPYLGKSYLHELSELILYAKSIGQRFWLYDENGWPSGTANGELLKRFPGDQCQRLDLVPGEKEGAVVTFHVSTDRQIIPASTKGTTCWSLVPQKVSGIDIYNPDASRHFLTLVHEAYEKGLAPEAFAYVEGFFTDEPESGISWDPRPVVAGVPWSRLMPGALTKVFGGDFARKLPLLFFPGDGCEQVRGDFWELATDLMAQGFFAPYLAWCQARGKLFIGHIKGEEHPLFQVPMVGSSHQVLRQLSWPGIDALERLPSNDFFPRQAASLAHQFGDGRSMVECCGGAGWGEQPEDLERYLLWLGRNGLTDFVLHLSQYRLNSAAIRDWPPSQPLHLTWRETYPEVLRRVRAELAANPPVTAPETLLIAPYRGIMAAYEPWELLQTNIHDGHNYPDTPAGKINDRFMATVARLQDAGVPFHVSDERTVEDSGRIGTEGSLQLGHCFYRRIVLGEGTRLNSVAEKLVTPLVVPESGTSKITPEVGVKKAAVVPFKIALAWKFPEKPRNALLLETTRGVNNFYETGFDLEMPFAASDLSLLVVDPVEEIFCNGTKLPGMEDETGWRFVLSGSSLSAHNVVSFRLREEIVNPFLWLEGTFRAISRTPYQSGPHGTVVTEGPFVLQDGGTDDPGNLIETGYPFLRKPLVAEATCELPQAGGRLILKNIAGDAARVSFDDQLPGWVWGPDWTITLPATFARGTHRLRIELIPGSYNFFGPHHYYRADAPLISPDQFAGIKNFADPDDAPAHTLVSGWHFKMLSLPTYVEWINQQIAAIAC